MKDKKKKKVIGIGFGNIFSGKQIELKTKENFNPSAAKINDTLTQQQQPQQQQPTLGKPQTHKSLPQALAIQSSEAPEPAAAETTPNATAPTAKPSTKTTARVLYNYAPTQPDELKLTAGEAIHILDKNLEDEGWWRGEVISTGKVGVFPENFVEETTPEPWPTVGLAAKRKSPQQPQPVAAPVVVVNTHNSAAAAAAVAKSNDSLTSSPSSSSSSSTNSISRPMEPMAPVNGKLKQQQQQPNGGAASIDDHLSKSQSDLSEDLDDLQQSDDRSKLTHIKKTRQFNKRPPSFRSKNKVNFEGFGALKAVYERN